MAVRVAAPAEGGGRSRVRVAVLVALLVAAVVVAGLLLLQPTD